ncbi:MAG: TonB-dependent receptor, partial [Gammaproteobacteria bacterium]|nr:TonB-dependent receptor [Gammaproteobacteria bacterium]
IGNVLGVSAPLDSEYGENQNTLFRPSLRWTPNDKLLIDFIAEYSETEGDSNAPHKQRDNTRGFPDSQKPDLGDFEEVNLSTNGVNEFEYKSFVIDARYETENGAWSWVTGYRDMDQYAMIDTDGGAGDIFVFVSNPEQEQISHEIRWSGTPWGDNFELTAGAYYFNQKIEYIEGRHIFGGLLTQTLGGDVDHTAVGLFVDTTWNINEKWALNLGLRYTDEEKEADISIPTDCVPITTTWSPSCTPSFSDDENWDNIGPAVTLQYFHSDDLNFYASAKRGYRSGGFNIRNSAAFPVSPKYDEETVDTWELGFKADLRDNLRVNASIFRSEYDDLQRVAVQPDSSQRTINAATSIIDGGEVEVYWLANDNFTITANIGFLDGEYDSLDPGALFALNRARLASRSPDGPFGAVTHNDLDLARLPDINYSVTAIYDLPLGESGLVTFRVSTKYVDERWNNDSNLFVLPDYTTVDFSVMYTTADDKWRVTAFGKNVTSADLFTSYTETSLYAYHVIQQPERYGVEISYKF